MYYSVTPELESQTELEFISSGNNELLHPLIDRTLDVPVKPLIILLFVLFTILLCCFDISLGFT